jgi:hypothetical protein
MVYWQRWECVVYVNNYAEFTTLGLFLGNFLWPLSEQDWAVVRDWRDIVVDHLAWPIVVGALLGKQREEPSPRHLLSFRAPTVPFRWGTLKLRALQGSKG